MNDARKRRDAKRTRRDARRTRKRHPTKADDDVFLSSVRKALAKQPANLLALASYLISVVTPEPNYSSLADFVDGIAGRRCRETTALLAVLAELLVEDDVLRERCREALATRHDYLPKWIAALPHVEVRRVLRRTEVLGDREELLVALRLAHAPELTIGVLLDHNALSAVTDVGVLTVPLDTWLARAHQGNVREPRFVDVNPADARSLIEYGLRLAKWLPGSDQCRDAQPLISWLITRLPGGGAPYFGPGWDDEDIGELLDGFFASAAGAPFTDVDYRHLLLQLCAAGCGDPSRWSARRISDILRYPVHDDYVPLEIALDAPALLRAFVPFAHADSGVRQDLTADAITTIDELSLRFKRGLLADAIHDEDVIGPPSNLAS
jgi:hypothetical protein